MRFAIASLDNEKIRKIIQILGIHCHDIDSCNPDFVITYGGDGTILFAERKYPGIPKITIRGSSGGYKCFYEGDLESVLEYILSKIDDGKYSFIEESKLETIFKERKYLSLNETQIHNSSPIKAVRFSAYTNGQQLFGGDIIGDGIVIATPFGSTAYYTSVGGRKFSKGIGIALNNPYNVRCRNPMVVGEDIEINIRILRDDGLLLFDNDDNMIKVKEGDRISINISKDTAKFITV